MTLLNHPCSTSDLLPLARTLLDTNCTDIWPVTFTSLAWERSVYLPVQ